MLVMYFAASEDEAMYNSSNSIPCYVNVGVILTLSPLKPVFKCIQHLKTGFSGERVKP